MRYRSLYSLLLAAAAIICISSSCKKEDDTVISPSLEGKLSYNICSYLTPGTKVTLTPSGVKHPDGETIGYYWRVSPTMTKSDTTRYENGLDKNGNESDGTFVHTFSDTLKTYTVTGYAYASGYTYTSRTQDVMVVAGGVDRSITNLGIAENSKTETIDGKTYHYVTVGGKDWLSRNIADPSCGAPYQNCTAMDDVFGRYYSFEEAKNICPEGWELPSEADWLAVAKEMGASEDTQAYETFEGITASLMGDGYFNDMKMWEYWPKVGAINNNSGLSMIPVGYAILGRENDDISDNNPFVDNRYPYANFLGTLEYAAFWTADMVEGKEMAYYRYIIADQPDMLISSADTKSFGASVRCVRN